MMRIGEHRALDELVLDTIKADRRRLLKNEIPWLAVCKLIRHQIMFFIIIIKFTISSYKNNLPLLKTKILK